MGICTSSQQHVLVAEEKAHQSHKKGSPQNYNKQQQDAALKMSPPKEPFQQARDESETSATEVLDETLPLTPVSLFEAYSPKRQNSRIGEKRVDNSSGADQPNAFADSQSFYSSAMSPNVAKNTRQGRALQARLQKAKYMQMVMSTSASDPASLANANSHSAMGSSASDEDMNSGVFSPLPVQYSMESQPHRHLQMNSLSNDEFEASLNESMIWAEVDCKSAVSAVALSRQQPSLDCTNPQLFLAIGTDDTLTLTELLEEAPLSKSKARLGSTIEMKREGRIRSIDFCPDGLCLACAGDDGMCTLIALEATPSKEHGLRVLAGIQRVDRIYAVRFSPNGQFLAIAGYDETVAIVDVTTMTKPRVVTEIPVDGLISTLGWSPDGELLAIGGSDKLCTLVDTQNWQILHDVRRSSAITSLQWHPLGGKYLAIGSTDVAIVDRASLQIVKEISFRDGGKGSIGRGARINDLCWSPEKGNYLMICSNGQQRAKLLETKTFSTIQEIKRSADVSTVVWGQQTVLSGTPQKYLAMGGSDKKCVILKAGLEVHGSAASSIGDDTSAASSYFSNRGDWVLSENAFRDVDDFSSPTAEPWVQSSPSSMEQKSLIHTVAFSKGSKSRPSAFFATASSDGLVTVRSTIGFKILCQLEFLDPITCIAFSNGSRLMACGSNDGKVRLVATAPVWTVVTVIDAEAPVQSLLFSSKNERLSILGVDGIMSLVDPENNFSLCGELTQDFITAIDWSSKYLATGHDDGTISVYESSEIINDSATVEASLSQPCPIRTLSLGANNRFLAVGGDDGMLSVYSCSNDWAMVHQMSFGFSISSMNWSPSGRHVSVMGQNDNLKVVDTVFWADITEINSSEDSANNILSMSFSQDGKLLAFADEHCGTRIVNTISWDVVLNVFGAPITPASSDEAL